MAIDAKYIVETPGLIALNVSFEYISRNRDSNGLPHM